MRKSSSLSSRLSGRIRRFVSTASPTRIAKSVCPSSCRRRARWDTSLGDIGTPSTSTKGTMAHTVARQTSCLPLVNGDTPSWGGAARDTAPQWGAVPPPPRCRRFQGSTWVEASAAALSPARCRSLRSGNTSITRTSNEPKPTLRSARPRVPLGASSGRRCSYWPCWKQTAGQSYGLFRFVLEPGRTYTGDELPLRITSSTASRALMAATAR